MAISESIMFNWEKLDENERKKKLRLYNNFIEAMGIDKVNEEYRREIREIGNDVNGFIRTIEREKAAKMAVKITEQINFIKKEETKAKSRVKNAVVVAGPEKGKQSEVDYSALKTQLIIALDVFGSMDKAASTDDGKAKAAAVAETIKANLNAIYVKNENGAAEKKIEMSDELIKQAGMAIQIGEVIKKGLDALHAEVNASAEGVQLSDAQRNENLSAIMKMQLVSPSFIREIKPKDPEIQQINKMKKAAKQQPKKGL